MKVKEKILLVELLLRDIRGNWGWENDGKICSRAIKSLDLCDEIANELNDSDFSELASSCNQYIRDYFEYSDGRFFRDEFPYGYIDMDSLHGLEPTFLDKSDDFKRAAEEYLTYPEFHFTDWEEVKEKRR